MTTRKRKGGGTEITLDGGKTWARLLPITFTADNAQKVHGGEKSQTRRIINPQPLERKQLMMDGEDLVAVAYRPERNITDRWKPRYRVGDVLWVQEPWRTHSSLNDVKPTKLPNKALIQHEGGFVGKLPLLGKLRPGRFMPLRFSQPTRLIVTEVRCERVNEISTADIQKEGVTTSARSRMDEAYISAWMSLWNSIHPKPGERFEDKPCVFAYTFKKI